MRLLAKGRWLPLTTYLLEVKIDGYLTGGRYFMQPGFFPLLILNARPAAGKSEIIHALRAVPLEERIARFHIGPMHIIDDFPMLWAWFEEDQLLEDVFNRPRLYTTSDQYFQHNDLWNLLIRRLCLEYEKRVRDSQKPHTVILEFSRGGEHGGYHSAYQHLSNLVLDQAACLYLKVSHAESLRKNQARFNPERPDSILQHGLSSEKLDHLYKEDDWIEFTHSDPAYIHVHGQSVPYVVFDNEDDVTTHGGELLFSRLEQCLAPLWALKYPDGAV
jgi:hypothetical protein